MSALNRISMAMAGLFGIGKAATPLANRNYIVDGAFEFGPGGQAALTVGGAYSTANMYYGACGLGGVATSGLTPARTNAVLASLDTNPNCVYTHIQTTPSTGTLAGRNLPGVWQAMEYVSKLAGKSVTISAKIWASANFTLPGIAASQNMGTGGSPSPNVVCDKAVNWAVTGVPTRFSVRLDLPAVSGLTLGTNNNDNTGIGFWFPPGFTGTIYVAEFQVELCSPRSSSDLNGNGGAPTSFEYRGLQAEYARMCRYIESGTQPFMFLGSYPVTGSTVAYTDARFMVQKRAAPAVSISNWQYYSSGSNTACPTPAGTGSYADKLQVQFTSLTNWNGWCGTGNWTADCRL